MRRYSITPLVTTFLILVMATLAAFGSAMPATAATTNVSIDPTYLYLNVAPDGTAEATVNVTADPGQSVFLSVNAGWLTVDQTRFLGSGTVRITASARGLRPGDIRVARISVALYPTEVALPVVLAVGGGNAPPPVAVTPARVDFGTLPVGQGSGQYLNLAFSAPTDGTITADADWIDVEPRTFNAATTRVVSVRPVLARIAAAQQYAGTIVVRAGSFPPVRIPVTLQVVSPEPAQAEGVAPAANSPFADVPAGHWARGAIAELAAGRLIDGLGNGRFAPDDPVTREQFAKLLVLALGLPPAAPPEAPPFPDVAADRWSAGYIVAAQPFMARYSDGLFRPGMPAVREEIAGALARAKGLKPAARPDLFIWFSDSSHIARTAQPWVAAARAAGLIDGFPDRTFRPTAPVTRAQVAVLLQRARSICGNPPQSGCAALLGAGDRTLVGASLKAPRDLVESTLGPSTGERPGYLNAYTRAYRDGQVTVDYVTPPQQAWSVLLQGEGATPRGIKIGDSVEAVRKAYGLQAELKNGALTYTAGAEYEYFYLRFFIVAGKVHAILLSQSK